MENLQPKLRFPEFKESWKSDKIGNLLSIQSGRDYKHLKEGKIPVYGTGGLMLHVDEFLHDGKSVCIGRKGTIDKPMFLNGKFWTVDTLFYSNNFKNTIPEFIYLCFLKINWKNHNEAGGVPSLSKKIINNIELNFPTLQEQTKIADFLGAVDKQLDILNQKKEKLNTYKKGVMQQLFAQQIRFKDDNGNNYPDWQEKCFDEIFESVPTKKYQIKSSEYLNEGVYPIVDQGQKFIVGFSNENEKVFKTKGSIIFGDHTTTLKYIDFNFIIGADGVKVLQSKTLNDIKFLYYNLSFNNVKSEGYKRHYSILKELKLHIPSIEEQTKIADFLSAIDKQIEAVENQITKTETYKKGLLQQMFV